MKTSKLSADNFKKILDLDGSTPEPAKRSGDTGQRIPCFDSCAVVTDVQSAFSWAPKVARKHYLAAWLESVRVNIGMPVVRTDGRAG